MPLFLVVIAVICWTVGALLALFSESLGPLGLWFLLLFGLACYGASDLPFWSRRP